jgi:hypothetical protein
MVRNNRFRMNLPTILNSGDFGRLTYGDGLNLFLVDTGVIIDLDQSYYGNGRSGESPDRLLRKFNYDHPLLITSGVMREIKDHREDRKITVSGRDEISKDTAVLSNELYAKSREFLRKLGFDDGLSIEDRDLHRLSARFAYEDAFSLDYRKGEKDRISDVDLGIISTALDLSRYHSFMDISCVINVLTTDSHIVKTIDNLKSPFDDGLNHCFNPDAITYINYKDYLVRPINTRGDLGGYLKDVA